MPSPSLRRRQSRATPETSLSDLTLFRDAQDAQVWHGTKNGSYIGSFRDDGFGPAPVAKLASELHDALPGVIGENSLCMQWGFKHDSHYGPEGILNRSPNPNPTHRRSHPKAFVSMPMKRW